MCEIIGQDRLRDRLNSLASIPRFIILEGQSGSGRRTIAEWLAEQRGFDKEIVESQKVDDIRSIIESSLTLSWPKLYIFPNAQDMNAQAMNALLKSLEEPSKNAHYIMTVNSLYNVIATIRSRAQIFAMNGYSREELAYFADEHPTLLEFCTTPGQIQRYAQIDYEGLIRHCENVVKNIGRINMANVFNILGHVKEKDYDLVIPTMQYAIQREIHAGADVQNMIRMLKIILDTSGLINFSSSINVRIALETMFLKLWEAA